MLFLERSEGRSLRFWQHWPFVLFLRKSHWFLQDPLFCFCGRAIGFCMILCFIYAEEPLVSVGSFGHFDGSKTCGRLLVTRIQGADEMRV